MKIIYDVSSAQPQGQIVTNGGGEYSIVVLEYILKHNYEHNIHILLDKKKGKSIKILNLINYYNLTYNEYGDYSEMSDILNDYDRIIFPIFYPSYADLKIDPEKNIIGLIHDLSSYYEYYIKNNKYEFIQGDRKDLLRYIYKKIVSNKMKKCCLSQHEKLFSLTDNTHVYTVSYYSKSAIEFFLPSCTVEGVFYSPLRKLQRNLENTEKNKYILLVNSSRWAKNNLRVAFAIDEMLNNPNFKKLSGCRVILTGCNESVKKYLKKNIRNINCFDICDFVSDEKLSQLYYGAQLFVYPSLLEGFGYPPIEAIGYGTMCACSTSTSIPEICGDAVVYFDPYDKDSIKMAINRCFDEEVSEQKKKKMKERLLELEEKQEQDLKSLSNLILK